MEEQKKCPKVQLTLRGKAVAKQKKDSEKKWFERYFSQKYYDTLELSQRLEKEIEENTDEKTSLFAPAFEVSTLMKDFSTKLSLSLIISNARKNCEVAVTGLIF